MPYVANQGAIGTTVLAAAVANGGTFTINYPSGFSQESFINGLEKPNASYGIVNNNDKYPAYGASGARFNLSYDASYITVTNNTGASLAAGASVALFADQQDDTDVITLMFPVDLVDVSAADIVTGFKPGVVGTIEDVQWIQRTAVSTASKAATITPKIGTTALTGGVLSLTSAACTPLGKVIAATQITGNNVLAIDSKISLTASAVTAFAEGRGTIAVRIRRAY